MNGKPPAPVNGFSLLNRGPTPEPNKEDGALAALGEGAERSGSGISVKNALSGVWVRPSSGNPRGISYAAFCSEIEMDKDQTSLRVKYETDGELMELVVTGTNLELIGQRLTWQQQAELHVGGMVTGVDIDKAEESAKEEKSAD